MNDVNLDGFYKQFPNELSCIQFLERIRWNDSPHCPHCNSSKVYKFSNGRQFKCSQCRKNFTVKVGTIFGDSKLPLRKWLLTIFLATNLPEGVSSSKLHKYAQVTQKTAWHMIQKIRKATEN